MEIHELNNFTGSLGASDYFATDNGTDTSKVSAEDMFGPLNARIDNIIAGGTAPSEAEVTDARLGAAVLGSEQYTSLGAAIRGQATELYDNITALADEIDSSVTGIRKIPVNWEQGGINGDNGAETTVNTQIRTAGYIYVGKGSQIVEECASGYGARLNFYNESSGSYTYMGHTNHSFGGKRVLVATGDYLRVSAYNSSYGNISPSAGSNIVVSLLVASNNEARIFTDPSRNLYASYDTYTKLLTFPSYAILVYGNERFNIASKTLDLSGTSGGIGLIYYNPKIDDVVILDGRSTMAYATLLSTEEYLYIGYIWLEFVSFNIFPSYLVNGVMCSSGDDAYIRFKQFSGVEKMAVLGDSISTFVGYNETQAEGYYSDGTYPTADVTTVDKTWWYQVAHALRFPPEGDPTTAVSLSAVSRSGFKLQSDPTIVPAYDSRRIDRLDINGYPALIYIAMGTNDCFSEVSTIGEAPDTISVSELSTMDMGKLYNAVYRTVRSVQDTYSGAVVVGLVPKWINVAASGLDYEKIKETLDAIKQAYVDLGVYVIDLRECGIYQSNIGTYTYDGIHPNALGMKKIARFIVAKTLEMGIANVSNY